MYTYKYTHLIHVSNPTKFGVYKGWAPKKKKKGLKEKRSLIFTLYVILWELNSDAQNIAARSIRGRVLRKSRRILYKVRCHNSPQIRVRLA